MEAYARVSSVKMKRSIIVALFAVLFLISVLSKCADAESESSEEDESSVVETESGRVRGRKNYTLFEKKAFYAFKGIPYAQAPIDELRFKVNQKMHFSQNFVPLLSFWFCDFQPPRKPVPWLDIYNAFEFGSECIQSQLFTNLIVGKENCLFLNVYVPIEAFSPSETSNKLAVMFYIHGGGYVTGSGDMYGPDFLIERNVILVRSLYRLISGGEMRQHESPFLVHLQLGHVQLSLGTVWIPYAEHARLFRQYGFERSTIGTEMGEQEHRAVWRR